MKNIIYTSKRSFIVILTLCIFLCTTGIGVHAISMPEENIAVTEEIAVVVEETAVATERIAIPTEEPIVATEDTTVVTEQITQELVPLMASDCPIYVQGIGWQGSQSWNNCVNTVAAGGTITDFGGIIVTEFVAKLMIADAGGQYLSTENGHLTGSHSYRHVHYLMYGTRHNVIRIQ